MPNLIKKIFNHLLIFLVLAYIAIIGIGISFSDQIIFQPQTPSYTLSNQHIIINSKSASNEASGHKIIAQYLENPKSKYTIIYSHGNAVDLGGLQHLLHNFYKHDLSIIIYDYSGYGQSEGMASEQQVYNDAQAIYDYLIYDKKINPKEIISYGHSLGAAVATELANNNAVSALILESSFTTAFRVKTRYPIVPFDKFNNIDKIKNIQAPVFITHSRDDRVIPFWHGTELFNVANEPKKFVEFKTEGHTQITHHKLFWPALRRFVSTL